MCSFILKHKVCKKCRSSIEYERADHRSCPSPKKCRGAKKRGTTTRYVRVDECNRCTLDSLNQDAMVGGVQAGDLDEEPDCLPERPLQLGLWM
jgi:hypothetical protein